MPFASFSFTPAKLHFCKKGTGDRIMIAFHGFGQTHKTFEPFAHAIGDSYTCYLIDLFFHGQSEWNQGEKTLEKEHWITLFESFLKQEGIQKMDLIGYSLGGKFVLALAEAIPRSINRIFLIAPDGIRISPWYTIATYPILLRKYFKKLVDKPEGFFALVNLASTLKLVKNSVLNFVKRQMDTPQKRNQVYLSWVVFRHLRFNTPQLAKMLSQSTIETIFFIGKYDNVIPAQRVTPLSSRLPHSRFVVLDTGHNGVFNEAIQIISTSIQNRNKMEEM